MVKGSIKMADLLYRTKSVCPSCLKVIDARIVEIDREIYMEKSCAEHGEYRELIWQDSRENYLNWLHYGGLTDFQVENDNCPYNCGFCKNHRQAVCSAALMVTNRCNADCPVCFTADSQNGFYEPPLNELVELLNYYRAAAGEGAPLEFCGGEPTVRDDLPDLAAAARNMGFDYIQLNTNGIRLAADFQYTLDLKKKGVTTVYLGFDGTSDGPYLYKYGRNLLADKLKAIANCSQAGLAVVLTPCIIPGVNDQEIGNIIRLAKEWLPTVRGVFFQPISYFGNYPANKRPRITIPAIIREIERQSGGEIPSGSFLPAACEHPQCSFNGFFRLDAAGKFRAITHFQKRAAGQNAAARVRRMLKSNWSPGAQKQLTIGGMAFQDAWNLDLGRLRRCTIGIIGKDQRLIPLCAKYLTNDKGKKLYAGIS
jgi:uncharacterized radical SAM superfamily Fe-S cluster-containing enzyme